MLASSYSDHSTTISNNQQKFRIFFVGILFAIGMVILVCRLFYLQIIHNKEMDSKLKGTIVRRTPVEAIRGQIYDRNGRILVENLNTLVTEITHGYLPKKKDKKENLISVMSKLLSIDVKEINSKLKKYNRPNSNKYLPVAIKSDVDTDVFVIINENKDLFPGISCQLRHWRNYILNQSISHIVGYTGVIDDKEYSSKKDDALYRQNSIVGKRGLEKKMDKYLRGIDGVQLQAWRPKGQPVPDTCKIDEPPEWGKDLYLTIDKELQEATYKLMTGKRGAVIITKANTGEILACIAAPGYDCNAFSKRDNEKIRKIQNDKNKPQFNRATRGTYPPSSIFKVVVAAAALEYGIACPTTHFSCSGGIQRWRRFFRCTGHHGNINLRRAIQKSCNAYFYQLGERVKYDNIIKMAKNFGLGTAFGLDIGEEDKGFLPTRETVKQQMKQYNKRTKKNEAVKIPAYSSGHTYNISIGQGYLAFPPIQIHNIISVIASKGKRYKPYFIKKIYNEETDNYDDVQSVLIKDKVLSQSTVQFIHKALRDAVTDGTAYYATFSKKYLIAGKTGTSQKKNKKPNALFSCYAPWNNIELPYGKDRIVVTVLVEEAGYGGSISAPIATALVLLYFENIPIEDTLKKMGLEITFEVKPKVVNKVIEGSSDGSPIDEEEKTLKQNPKIKSNKEKTRKKLNTKVTSDNLKSPKVIDIDEVQKLNGN